jgi:hypothetical protein
MPLSLTLARGNGGGMRAESRLRAAHERALQVVGFEHLKIARDRPILTERN